MVTMKVIVHAGIISGGWKDLIPCSGQQKKGCLVLETVTVQDLTRKIVI